MCSVIQNSHTLSARVSLMSRSCPTSPPPHPHGSCEFFYIEYVKSTPCRILMTPVSVVYYIDSFSRNKIGLSVASILLRFKLDGCARDYGWHELYAYEVMLSNFQV